MDGGRTTKRQYSEYSDIFFLHNENQSTIKIQTPTCGGPTQVRQGGQDGRREPDSGLGYTQDYRTRGTQDDWVDPDSFTQRTEQPVGRKRREGGRPAVDRIREETVTHRDNRWDTPRKRPSPRSCSDGPNGERMKNEQMKFLNRQCNPMYFQGVGTIMKSDSTGPRRFGRPWPDVGRLHRFTNTAFPEI